MRLDSRSFSVLLVSLVLLATAAPADAGDPEHANAQRTLGEHIFLPSTTVADPFINTFFRTSTGMSYAGSLDLPPVIIEGGIGDPDTLGELSGDLLFVNLGLEFQSAIAERWALRFQGTGGTRVGTSGESMLTQGVTAIFSGEMGLLFRLWHNDRTMVTLEVDVGYSSGLAVDVTEFLEAWLGTGPTTASLVQTDGGAAYGVGARAAWAANRWIGIKARGIVGQSEMDVRQEDVIWDVSVAVDLDFKQKGSIPLGLIGSFRADGLKLAADPVGTAIGGGLGVYYTGEERFVVGLEFAIAKIPYKDPEINAYPVAGRLALRYFF